jgi:hypothetical protein
MQTRHDPQPPASAKELDLLMHRIDLGQDGFAALSDEQRTQLKAELAEDWISGFLDDYPVPDNIEQAAREYRAIQSGALFPNIPDRVRNDILIQFDERHAEGGGPDHWATGTHS